jgi:uncharacterized protein DUF6982
LSPHRPVGKIRPGVGKYYLGYTPQENTPIHESGKEGHISSKVIIRYADGRVVRAFAAAGAIITKPPGPAKLDLRDSEGAAIDLNASDIKAVFVVKSFEGDPNYVEFKSFPERPGGPGLWLRVRFLDGENIEGVAPNSLATFAKSIFFMTPPDPRSNNQAVLVSKPSLADMQVLGFESE